MKPALLYLVHRIPYPPNKGDKIRSFNLLKVLADRYQVFLGAFVEAPFEQAHAEALRGYCERLFLAPLNPTWSQIRSVGGFLKRAPLTLYYYRSASLRAWVNTVIRRHAVRRALVFSSSMAQFALGENWRHVRRVVDFVDVDSDKWRQYAATRPWPMQWVYQREARTLLDFERRVIGEFDAGVFVSSHEADLFRLLAPEVAGKVTHADNGVDLEYFAADSVSASPYASSDKAIVFVGTMDYWPNVQAVGWFAKKIFPVIKARIEQARFFVVGSNPSKAVSALGKREGVEVTGQVDDVRPYVKHAAVSVAPLRIARGVQNKVLESMSLGRPTVVTPAALEGINAEPGCDVLVATSEAQFAEKVCQVLTGEIDSERLGVAARACVERGYNWGSNLAVFSNLLEGRDTSVAPEALTAHT